MNSQKENAPQNLQEMHESLLNHIVLPRFLPQSTSVEFHSHELELLMRMMQNVESFADYITPSAMKMCRSLSQVHRTRTKEVISKQIEDLMPGDTFAMFIRRQNCGIMIHNPKNGSNLIVATFPGKLRPEEVYGHQSDLEFNFPTQAIKVPNSQMLRSTEFAYQLCYLYENEPVNSKHRDYISKWLVTTLMDEGSSTATEQEFPVIRKKIRDEMLGEPKNHFRRSNFFMAAKVFLLQKLTHDMGENRANFLYKIIMLQFLDRQCDVFNETYCKKLNIELVTQTMAKLARRSEKLSEMKEQQVEDKYRDLAERVIQNAYRTIQETRIKVNAQIEHLQSNEALQSTLKPLIDLDFEADIYQRVPKLRDHIKQRSDGNVEFVEPTLQVKEYQRHYMAQPNPPPIACNSNEIDQHFITTDFENWILYDLKINETHFASSDLRSWCESYINLAQTFYKSDQLGVSKSVLVSLKMIAMLDKIATTAYPMLLRHNSGINTKIIDHILLPQLSDMKIVYELEKYFNERNLNAKFPSLIGESKVTGKSFSARYAATNSNMQTLLNEIEVMGKRKIEEKREEWIRRRVEVQNLRDRAARLSCEYYTSVYHGWTHRSSCERCRLTNEANSIKICVYESR